ncbi:MAG: hypothetical protein CMB31_07570 [Euryarchaeota archaeon]|nr:hypothetical protein [Euryarchaeota archaeon]
MGIVIQMMDGELVQMELQMHSLKIEFNGLTLMVMDLEIMALVHSVMIVQKFQENQPLICKDVLMQMVMVIRIVSVS